MLVFFFLVDVVQVSLKRGILGNLSNEMWQYAQKVKFIVPHRT